MQFAGGRIGSAPVAGQTFRTESELWDFTQERVKILGGSKLGQRPGATKCRLGPGSRRDAENLFIAVASVAFLDLGKLPSAEMPSR